jgi:hypothetical protein
MNKKECCNQDCNQGRDCPLRQRNLAEEITEGFKALETMRTLTDEEIQEVIDEPQFECVFNLEDFAKAILKKLSGK